MEKTVYIAKKLFFFHVFAFYYCAWFVSMGERAYVCKLFGAARILQLRKIHAFNYKKKIVLKHQNALSCSLLASSSYLCCFSIVCPTHSCSSTATQRSTNFFLFLHFSFHFFFCEHRRLCEHVCAISAISKSVKFNKNALAKNKDATF